MEGYRSIIGEALIFSDPFQTRLDSQPVFTLSGTQKIDGQKCWVVQTKDEYENKEFTRQFYIHKNTHLQLRVKSFFQDAYLVHKSEWNATDVNYNHNFKEGEFNRPVLPSGYKTVFIKAWE